MQLQPRVRIKWALWLAINLPTCVILALLAYVLGSSGDAACIVRDYRKLWTAVLTGRQQ